MRDEEEFVNIIEYLGNEWSNGWDKRSCRINGRGEILLFDRDIEDLYISTKYIVS